MDDEPLHERIRSYEQLTADLRELKSEREAIADDVANQLAETLTDTVSEVGTNVAPIERSDDGHRYRFEARLDRAAVVAAVTEQLPDGFVVSHVNDDGTLSIEWTGERATPSGREHGAILIVTRWKGCYVRSVKQGMNARDRATIRASEHVIVTGPCAKEAESWASQLD